MDLLGDASFQRLEAALQASSLRQQVLANNVANVDTPYFKRSDVAFEELLSQAMGQGGTQDLAGRRTDPRHIPIGNEGPVPAPQVVTDSSTAINNNRNNVDIDKEMALMAENQLRYNLFVQQVNEHIRLLKIGINGRSGA